VEKAQSFKYRIDPTAEQERLLWSAIGGSRFAYNHLLGLVKDNWAQVRAEKQASDDGETHATEYVSTSHFGLLYLWADVRDDAAPWWAQNSSQAYNDAALRLSKSFTNWKQGRAGFPKFKKRRETGSVKFCGTSFGLVDRHHVRLAKVGQIKTYESMRKLARKLEKNTAKVTSVTVSRETGGWFVSFTATVQRPDPAPRTGSRVVGVDVGLTALFTGATPSGGQVLSVENPRNYAKSQRRLAKAQRVTSRRQGPARGVTPSNRWRRANVRVQKCHARVANQRRNLLHNTTTRLVKDFDVIVVEDLNVAGMARNKHLARHIHDASWTEFVRQLTYKAEWYGATVIKADRFYPSSKTCSGCGEVKAKLSLTMRTYCCDHCGVSIDRDVNAAVNLARLGEPASVLGQETRSAGTRSVAGRGGRHKTPTDREQSQLVEAVAAEASTLPTV
jgi:putative transposase